MAERRKERNKGLNVVAARWRCLVTVLVTVLGLAAGFWQIGRDGEM